jgi:uncharacterized protein (DUF4415 family)
MLMKKKNKRQGKAPSASKMRAAKKSTAPGRKIGSLKASADDWGTPSKSQDWMPQVGKWYRPIKRPVTLRLDADVVAWFQAPGRGYQTRINRALRRVMMEQRKSGSRE